jgi:hypothetical protein
LCCTVIFSVIPGVGNSITCSYCPHSVIAGIPFVWLDALVCLVLTVFAERGAAHSQ